MFSGACVLVPVLTRGAAFKHVVVRENTRAKSFSRLGSDNWEIGKSPLPHHSHKGLCVRVGKRELGFTLRARLARLL